MSSSRDRLDEVTEMRGKRRVPTTKSQNENGYTLMASNISEQFLELYNIASTRINQLCMKKLLKYKISVTYFYALSTVI